VSKCQCCGYCGKARFEYLELLRPLHRRIANQRREITRLLAIEAAWLFEGMAKAEAALAAQRAGLETGPVHVESKDCWCHPTLDYTDPETGVQHWIHHEPM
jgi:hypothetical protein